MTHAVAMFAVLLAFCCAIGYGLAVNHANAWTMLLVAITIWIAVPISYAIGVLLDG
jgi:hypothetical protein